MRLIAGKCHKYKGKLIFYHEASPLVKLVATLSFEMVGGDVYVILRI
jgi:hypothetical protein